jgi:hypothetical protein
MVEQFAETGGRHAFRLKDGSHREGWAGFVDGSVLFFCPAPGPFALNPQEEWIDLNHIDIGTLEYWDDTPRAWRAFLPR